MGCDVFIDELIPHIDATYRTVAERGGRGLEGFSQGGRGTVLVTGGYDRTVRCWDLRSRGRGAIQVLDCFGDSVTSVLGRGGGGG